MDYSDGGELGLYRASRSNRGDARKCIDRGGRARTRLDQFAGSVEIEARKFAINLAADWRNIHEEQSFPGYFWLADQEC